MRRKRTLAALLAGTLLLTGCRGGGSGPDLLGLTAGTLEGGTTSLGEQIDGEWAVVNFWASFCEPCVREMPALQQLSQQEQVLVVGVNAADRNQFAISTIEETGVTYPIITDERGDLMAAAQIRSLPGTLVIDPDGRIVGRHVGELSLPEMLQLMEESGWPDR